MLRPISPFIEYMINYDYISKVLCINKNKPELSCNGKCHLMKILKKEQEKDFNSLRINMEEYPIGFVDVLYFSKKVLHQNLKSKKIFYPNKNYSFNFYTEIFHPPIT